MARRLYANLAGVELGDGFPVRIVAAVNVSPESFYAGSVAHDAAALQRLGEQLVNEGADIVDVGAMSTAPYRQGQVSIEEETSRVVTAVRALRSVVDVPISVDTQRSAVASAALAEGARIINDISGLSADATMAEAARDAEGLILMAFERGPSSGDPAVTARSLLRQSLRRAQAAGLDPQRVVVDPGVGFYRRGPRPWHEVDCLLLRDLARLRSLGCPLLVGASRKSFLGKLTDRPDADERLAASLAAAAVAVWNGAAAIRAHDVAATRDAVRVAQAIREIGEPSS